MKNELYHHGVKGMKWGVIRTKQQLGYKTISGAQSPEELSDYMRKHISYSDFTKLKSPEEVISKGKGSCHDQVMLELSELRKMGKNPKAAFLIEYNPKMGTGGTTHSFVYYKDKGKINWLENAWKGQEGVHIFNNLSEIKGYIITQHILGSFGSRNDYPNIEFSDFKDHVPGESLQEVVDKSLR